MAHKYPCKISMRDKSKIFLNGVSGRIRLELTALQIGADLQVLLYGGDSHIGAVALASPGGQTFSAGLPAHREEKLAAGIAAFLAGELGCNVALSAGIHYDAISKTEIESAVNLAWRLAAALTEKLKSGCAMLTMNDLNEFEDYIKSGRLESEFKCSPEDKRIRILELLEKLMDVADLADEAATRLIFRGQIPEKAH